MAAARDHGGVEEFFTYGAAKAGFERREGRELSREPVGWVRCVGGGGGGHG